MTVQAHAPRPMSESRLTLGVLGPVQLRFDGQPHLIGSEALRRFVVLLALRAGEPVSRDEIADVLWGDAPPRTFANRISVLAGQLRALLEPQAARPVVSGGRGRTYTLHLTADELDVIQFTENVGRVHRPVAAGDLEAFNLLSVALDCWRGPVAGGLDERIVHHPAALALHRSRVEAALMLAEVADTALQHHQVAALLEGVVEQEPLHEGLHARLIHAVAAAGDSGTALKRYADVRARLQADLGVEPSRTLQRIHLAILRTPAEADELNSNSVPMLLPADVPQFAGRERETALLDQIAAVGSTGRRLAVLSGTAGVGKTALAVHWAHGVRSDFPDGQLYLDLRGYDPSGRAMSPNEALQLLLPAVGAPPAEIPVGLDARRNLYRSQVASRRMLIVLDNARDVTQVRPLLPTGSSAMTVITSRNRLSGLVATDAADPVPVDLMSAAEAHQMMVARLGNARVASDPAATERIIAACARLPLALAIAAARVLESGFHLDAVAGELERAVHRLDAFDGGDPVSQVRAAFSWSYRSLSAPAADLFRLLGVLPGPEVSTDAAASLAALPLAEMRRRLLELARASLLAERAPDRWAFHDLLRFYAGELAEQDQNADERRRAVHRLLDHYLHSGLAAARFLCVMGERLTPAPPQPGVRPNQPTHRRQALDWFEAERTALLASVHLAADAGFDPHVWQLASTVADYDLTVRPLDGDDLALYQMAVDAADRLGDAAAAAYSLRTLAEAHLRLGEYRVAHQHLKRALELCAVTGDRTEQAQAHHAMGRVLAAEHRWAAAYEQEVRALALFDETGHRSGQARALNGLGWYGAQVGDPRQALDDCRRALRLLGPNGCGRATASVWDCIGSIHRQLGEFGSAVTAYQRAVARLRGMSYHEDLAQALIGLGHAHHDAGDRKPARTAWCEALDILTRLHHPAADSVRAELAALDTATV